MLKRTVRGLVAASFLTSSVVSPVYANASRDAEISRMEGLLAVSCDPVLELLQTLIASGKEYRNAIAKAEAEFAAEQDRFSNMLGDFALPIEAPDGLSFRFFQEFTKIREDAVAKGLLGPNDQLKGVGFGRLAALNRKGKRAFTPKGQKTIPLSKEQAALLKFADQTFFTAKSEEERKEFERQRKELQQRIDAFKETYKTRRAEFRKLYTGDALSSLNRFYDEGVRKRVDTARSTYLFHRNKLQEMAFSREFEHCLGPIEADQIQSVSRDVIGEVPLVQKGADNTLLGIPGMGFNVQARARTGKFDNQEIPEFPYKINLKRDAEVFIGLQADINLAKVRAIMQVIRDYAGIFANTRFELVAASGGRLATGFAEYLAEMIEIRAKNGFNPLAEIAMAQLAMSSTLENRSRNVTAGEEFEKAKQLIVGGLSSALEKLQNGMAGYNTLRAAGLIDEDGFMRPEKIDAIEKMTPVARLEISESLLESASAVDDANQLVADVGVQVVGFFSDGALTAGAGVVGSVGTKVALVAKAQRSLRKLKKSGAALGGAAKRASGKTGQVGKLRADIDKTTKQLDDVRVKQEQAFDDTSKLAKNGDDGAGPIDGTRPKFEPGEGIPEGNGVVELDTVKGPDGQDIKVSGRKLAQGGGAEIFIDEANPNQVIRFQELNSDAAKLDNLGRKNLVEADLQSIEVLVPEAQTTKRLVNTKDGPKPAQVQVVPRVLDAEKQIANQGGKLTPGQAKALEEMRKELLSKGIVSTDGKFANMTFVNKTGDEWKVGIIDPGGFEKVGSPADAEIFQKILDKAMRDGEGKGKTASREVVAQGTFLRLHKASREIAGVGFKELLEKHDMDFLGQNPGGRVIGITPPVEKGMYPVLRAAEERLDISDRVKKFNDSKKVLQKLDDEVGELTKRSDALVKQADGISDNTKGVNQAAKAAQGNAEAAAAQAAKAAKDLKDAQAIRPVEVTEALLAITKPGRVSLKSAAIVASTTKSAAECGRLRAKLAKGDASDDIKKLAAEKCNLVVAANQQPQAGQEAVR